MNIANQSLLNQSLTTAKAKLKVFADRSDYLAQLKIAFGEDFNPDIALGIESSIKAGDYSFLPSIEIRTSAELAGGNGAYDAANNRIFVSADFLAQNANNPNSITNLLLEEIGQKFDFLLNGVKDSAGDEGAIFSAVSQGQTLSASDLAALKAENDRQILTIDGNQVAVEMQNFTVSSGIPNVTGSESDDVITGNGIDNTLIGLAGNDTIYGSGGNDTIQGGNDNDTLYGDSSGSNAVVAAADVNVFTGYNGAGAVNLASKILSANSGLTIVTGSATYAGANVATSTFNSIDLGTVSSTAANGTVNTTSYALGGGILLTTGNAAVPLTNTKASTTTDVTTSYSFENNRAGDAQINKVITDAFGAAGATQDASVLTFDFTTVAGATEVSLDVMFGSEEFPEFSGSTYVDIAAVFVDGKNYALFNNNLAQPLSILDINKVAGNLTDNLDSKLNIEYDAISSPLRVVAKLDPTKTTHTIKIAIADTGDKRVDSGIFVSNFQVNNQSSEFSSLGLLNDDNLQGGAGNDTLYGEIGNDSIDGGTGVDTMIGGVGNDSYVVDNAGDIVTELVDEGTDTVNASINYNLNANVEKLTLTGTDSINGTGNASDNEIVGNIASNTLDGGAGADKLSGAGGNDTYIVDNSGDVVVEKIAEGTDTVNASINYNLTTNVENLTLTGTATTGTGNILDNVITGNSGNNTLDGDAGNDTLDGGTGDDTLTGGVGDDTYIVDTTGDVVVELANAGTDTVKAGITYTLGANLENLTLTGTGNIDGKGNSGNNTITGNSGNNALDGISGIDTLIGGLGNDIYTINNSASVITELSNGGNDDIYTNVSYTLGTDVSIETMYLSGYGTNIVNATGNNLNNTIIDIDMVGGDNILDGGAGNDTLKGGKGNDTYIVDTTGDVVTENANEGTDTVKAGITYILGDNLENLTLTGTGDIDGKGNSGNNTITGNSGNNALNGISGIDTLIGGLGDDIYTINNSATVITELSAQGNDQVYTNVSYTLGTDVSVETMYLSGYGTNTVNAGGNNLDNTIIDNGGGNNTIDGGGGNDNLQGGGGNDTYIVDSTGDVVTESADNGTDTVNAGANYSLSANVENLTLTGISNISGTGNASDNTITGNDGNNILDGGAGIDALIGGLGNDTYVVDVAGDVVTEAANAGTDTVKAGIDYVLSANLENLTLTGNTALTGTGNASSNVIIGNIANNTLTGAAGNDEYKFAAGALAAGASVLSVFGTDTITDFVSAADKIFLSSATFTALTADANGFITNFASVATDILVETNAAAIVYSKESGKLFYNANGAGTGLGAGGNFLILTGKPDIQATDIKVDDIPVSTGTSVVTLAAAPTTVTEDGDPNIVYTFTRTGSTTAALTVNYGITGTADNGTDYAQTGNSVTFLAGENTATVVIDPTADRTLENTETVALKLTAGSGYAVGTTAAVEALITDDDANITLTVAPPSVTEDGTPNIEYTFTRTGSTTNPLTVNYGITGTAINGNDYASIGSTVTFTAGSSTATVIINPSLDTAPESDETVELTLQSGTNYKVGTTNAVIGTITNDDINVTLAVSTPTSVGENGADLVYTFTRTGNPASALTVNYTIGGGVTTSGTDLDYDIKIGGATVAATTRSVTFAAGATTATVTIDPKDDILVESNETVILTLATGTNGNNYNIVTPTAATGTIVDNDAAIIGVAVSKTGTSITPAGQVFENSGENLVYTFTRTGSTASALTVNYTIANGGNNAVAGSDYDIQIGGVTVATNTRTVTFAAGSDKAIVTIDPKDDTNVENNETVTLTLGNATTSPYALGTNNAATGTILNDDTNVTVAVSPAIVQEDDSTKNLVYTFTRTGLTTNALTVDYTLGGTADNNDYDVKIGSPLATTSNRTVTFTAGSNKAIVTIDPKADTAVETDETVILTLTSPSVNSKYTIGATPATGTIQNDETQINLAVTPGSVFENGTQDMVYTFTRTGLTTSALTVNYTLGGTATNLTDYELTGGAVTTTTRTVTFDAGSATAKITVNPTPDSLLEGKETVVLTVATGTGYSIGAANTATGDITNVGLGTISGIKWNDLNGNGVREELIQGTSPDVVFVIDKSGSTKAQFQGLAIGDVNGDGKFNTRLDAEVAAFIALNNRLVEKNLGNTAKISIIAFDDNATQFDMNLSLSGTQLFTTAAADSDNNGIKDVEQLLKSLRDGGGTNFESGLQRAVTTFNTQATAATNRNLIFISDGENNEGGTFTDEVQTLKNSGVLLSSFGVGTDSSITSLRQINSNASVLNSTDELFAVFDGLGSPTQNFKESTLAGITIYLDANNNGSLDTNELSQVTDATGKYSFANVAPGDYYVREVVPTGFTQTTANVKTTLVAGDIANVNFGNIAFPTITLAVAPASVDEDGTANLIYTFTRTGNLANAQTVNYTVGGSGTFNTDYTQQGAASFTATTGTITFGANLSTATLTIDPTVDNVVEANETVALTLASGNGYTVGTQNAVVGTILNDEVEVTLSVEPAPVTEDGADKLIYTFTRTGSKTNSLAVNYTVGGSASISGSGADYVIEGAGGVATTRIVTFAAGADKATVVIDPTVDTVVEDNETVELILASGSGYTVGTPTKATGTISNDDFKPIITLAATVGTVSEDGATNLEYTFTRTGSLDLALTVKYEVGGVASNGTDYALSGNSTVTFAVGSNQATVTIDPTADNIVEQTENITFKLVADNAYTVGTTAPVEAFLTDDDATVTLAATVATVAEDGTTNLVYTFTREGYTASELTVNYEIGGVAMNGTDYATTGNTVTFAAGATTATVTIDPTADNLVESTEDITFKLVAGNGYAVGTTTPVTAFLTDDDATVTLAATVATVAEDGTTNLEYTFTREGFTASELTVNYVIDGTATNGTDYAQTGNSVTFAAGATTAKVTIDPTADTVVEDTETIRFTLADGKGYTIGTTTPVAASITDDDTNVTLAATVDTVIEGDGNNLEYTFTRTGNKESELTVQYGITGTAENGTDYATTGNTVTFAAGADKATVTIAPTSDNLVELTEKILFTLEAGNGYSIGTSGSVEALIGDDDANVTLAATVATVTEDGVANLVYTFTRTGNTSPELTVDYLIDGTATNGLDYAQISRSVTFAARSATATVTIDPTNDNLVEGLETVRFTLAAGTGYAIGTSDPVVASIVDDDNLYVVNVVNDVVTINNTVNDTVTDTNNGNDTIDLTTITTGVVIDLSVTTPQELTSTTTLVIPVVNIENVIGSTGNDVITGNTLNNVLTGGTGDDIFIFGSEPLPTGLTVENIFGHDTIADFTRNSDKVFLNPLTFTNLTFGTDGNISFVTIAGNEGIPSMGLTYNSTTGNLFYDGAKFLTFTGTPELTGSDFLTAGSAG